MSRLGIDRTTGQVYEGKEDPRYLAVPTSALACTVLRWRSHFPMKSWALHISSRRFRCRARDQCWTFARSSPTLFA
jgi:hypothetical protein